MYFNKLNQRLCRISGFHSSGYEEFCLLRHNTVLLEDNHSVGGTYCLLLQGWKVSQAGNQHKVGRSKRNEININIGGFVSAISYGMNTTPRCGTYDITLYPVSKKINIKISL
jgi:hypothetical protein